MIYEMLTGEPPFQGATVQAIVAKVLTERPAAPGVVRESVPASLEVAVLKALSRLPADRFQSAAAFGAALSSAADAQLPRRGAAKQSGRPRAVMGAAVVTAGVVAAFFLGRSAGTGHGSGVERFGQATQVTWEPGLEIMPAISPDGKQVAYTVGDGTRSRIYLRAVAGDGRSR